MKLCIISDTFPMQRSPGAGLVPYFLAKYMPGRILFVTWMHGEGAQALPEHVELVTIVGKRNPLSASARRIIYSETRNNWLTKPLAYGSFFIDSGLLALSVRSILPIIRFRPSVIAGHSMAMLPLGLLLKACLRARFILWFHNATDVELIQGHSLLTKAVQQVDLVICVSENIYSNLGNIVPSERRAVVTTGVDLGNFRNMSLPRKPQLVTVGSFKWKKGYPVLLDTMSQVFRRYPDYRLVVIGEGPERSGVENQVRALGLEDNVTLLGTVQQDELARILNESRLFVLASLREGLPKALLEALACGTPAVVTDACNANDLLNGAGMVVPSGDSQALADAIATMLNKSDHDWAQYSNHAVQVAQSYDWQRISSLAYSHYRSLLQR